MYNDIQIIIMAGGVGSRFWPMSTPDYPKQFIPDFDYASPILDFSIFRGQNRHFCPRLVSFEHQTKA